MEAAIFRLEQDKPISAEGNVTSLDALPLSKEGNYWIALVEISAENLETLLYELEIHPLIIDDCLHETRRTLIERFPGTIYLEFPTNLSAESDTAAYLSIICLPERIITLSRGRIPKLESDTRVAQADIPLDIGSTADFLRLLLDVFMENTVVTTLHLRQRLVKLEKLMSTDPDDLDWREIVQLRHEITQLESVAEDQLYCVKGLASGRAENVLAVQRQQAYFNDLVSDGEYALRALERLSERVKDLQSNYQLQRHDSSEKRLRILTIISAVMLPLTFITGYFGMNFQDMPLLQAPLGNSIAVGVMVVLAIALLFYFYRNQWFD